MGYFVDVIRGYTISIGRSIPMGDKRVRVVGNIPSTTTRLEKFTTLMLRLIY